MILKISLKKKKLIRRNLNNINLDNINIDTPGNEILDFNQKNFDLDN
jgi:hypothetical protein